MKDFNVFEPMLLSEEKMPFNSKDFLYEMKFDGLRALIFVSPDAITIYNRHKRDITYLFPELYKLQEIVDKPTIFDGEIVRFLGGVPNFLELQKRIHLKGEQKILRASKLQPVVFVCFDIVYYGVDMSEYSLINRKEILNHFSDTDEFVKILYVFEKGVSFFQEIKSLSLEGMVAKKIDSIYEKNIRTNNWIKIKNIQVDSFFIGGYRFGKSTSMFSVILGEYVDKSFVFVGKVSVPQKSGLLEVLKKEKKLKNPVFSNFCETDTFYVKPKYLCDVEFLERSSNGILRHAVYRGYDK